MPARTIAIGDVHGCSQALRAVLDEIEPQAEDRLVMLGDYVDRGPDSRGVIDMLLELRGQCELVTLLGNHELMMYGALVDEDRLRFWLNYGGRQTLASYGGALEEIPASHREFIENCLPFFETDTHIFIHANYDPNLPLREQPEALAFWTHLGGRVPPPHCSGKTVIVGHTPQPDAEIRDWGHLLCLDTCCFGGGWLTALDVASQDIWQADLHGHVRR